MNGKKRYVRICIIVFRLMVHMYPGFKSSHFVRKRGLQAQISVKRGCFFKLENADMSSFTVLSEGAGFRRLIWTGFPIYLTRGRGREKPLF